MNSKRISENSRKSQPLDDFEKELEWWNSRLREKFEVIETFKEAKKIVEKLDCETNRILFRYPEHDIISACVGTYETLTLINRPSTYFAVSALIRNVRNLAAELNTHSSSEWHGESSDLNESIDNWNICAIAAVTGEISLKREAEVVDELIAKGFTFVYVAYGSEIHHRWNKYVGD